MGHGHFALLKRYSRGTRFWGLMALVLVPVFYRANPDSVVRGRSYLTDWVYTHYLFTYEDGFIKRGLVGDTMHRLFGFVSYELVSTVAYVSLFVLVLLLVHISTAPWRGAPERPGGLILALLVLTSPVTLQHFAFDVGRFDVFLYLVALLALSLVGWRAKPRIVEVLPGVTILLALAILIHEAAFFIVVPLVIVFWHYRDPSRPAVYFQLAVSGLLLVLTWYVSTRGGSTAFSMEEHMVRLQSVYGERVSDLSLSVLYASSLDEHFLRTLESGVSLGRVLHHLTMAAFLLPLGMLIYRLAIGLRSVYTRRLGLLIAASLAPLALYPLGHDHFRWWSLAICNLFLVTIVLTLHDRRVGSEILDVLEERRWLALAVILAGFLSGPLRVTESFDIAIWFFGVAGLPVR